MATKTETELEAPTWGDALENGEIKHRGGHHKPDKRVTRNQTRGCGCESMTKGGNAYRDVTIKMPDGRYVHFYHQSPVVVEKNGTYRLSNCGWNTLTTKERINRYLPDGYYVRQENYVWYLETGDERIEFKNGMQIEEN